MKRLIIDLDGTLASAESGDYACARVVDGVREQIRQYKAAGFAIVISTSRNMRTFSGDIGKINAQTLPVIVEWLKRHDIPFDEILVGKPWCGTDGFYVDDRAIRPDEFVSKTYEEIRALLDDTARRLKAL